ncbi:MAG: YdcF family protein [Magnetospirillum sp.]|nr:YdcF family protein [Magnetospirillum sp.]
MRQDGRWLSRLLARIVRGAASIVKVAGAVALAWFAGLVWFAATVPDHVEDPDTRTDAIVVLTGGSVRTATGVALLEAGRADRLFISGVHKGVDVDEILRRNHAPRPELEGKIVLGYAADDTIGNAAETAAWIAGEHLTSLRLVTAAYHMRRSLWEFRQAMPDVAIIPNPVFPEGVKSRDWWRWPGTAALLATEYSKYLAAIVRHWFVPNGIAPP